MMVDNTEPDSEKDEVALELFDRLRVTLNKVEGVNVPRVFPLESTVTYKYSVTSIAIAEAIKARVEARIEVFIV